MAVFQIEEFTALGKMAAPVPQYPPVAIQNVTVGGSSASSSAFNTRTVYARIVSDTACHFKVGTSPQTAVADATSSYLPANVPLDIGVQAGHIVAVITG
jgi:hypothetical protein